MYIKNRMRQLASGRAVCHETSCPTDGVDKEVSTSLAKKLVMGRLLAKDAQRLARDRSVLQQSAAFATARQVASHAEQKSIMTG